MHPTFSAASLAALPRVAHAFTGRGADLARRDDGGWSRAAGALGFSVADVAVVDQVHGADVVVVDRAGGPCAPRGRADALVTATPGVVLAVRVADCVPVLMALDGR